MARTELQVGRKDMDVFIVLDGRRVLDLGWRKALDFAKALRTQISAVCLSETSNTALIANELSVGTLSVRCAGGDVLVLHNGQLLFTMPWKFASRLWSALVTKAREADEIAHADQIAYDGAILLRTGSPFGFTNHPKIQEEIVKEAVHNRNLRRYLPEGIKGTVVHGAPVICQLAPIQEMRSLAAKLSTQDRRTLATQLIAA